MSGRRPLLLTNVILAIAFVCFSLGTWWSQRAMAKQIADKAARVNALHDEMALNILQFRQAQKPRPLGTGGSSAADRETGGTDSETALVDEVKKQLQSEMGLLPVRLLRQRRNSFVE